MWQYASIGEVLGILKAVILAEVGFVLLHLISVALMPQLVVPKAFYFSWVFIFLLVGGSRFVWRVFRDTFLKQTGEEKGRKVLIVGAGEAGVLVAKELQRSRYSHLQPVAFIDDDSRKQGLQIMGLPVVGGREAIGKAITRFNIDQIVIAMPSAPRREQANIIRRCKDSKVSVKILPRVSDLLNGKVSVSMIREVKVEDLLGRDPINVDLEEISDYIRGQIVLVTGAGGSIGSELCRQLARFAPKQLLLLGHGENSIYEIEQELKRSSSELSTEPIIADIQDRQRMENVFATYRPHVVFHAAAHKHVPLMEKNPVEAIKNNVLGTKNVAECAHRYSVKRFVMISTDKAVNPTNVMGATKRVAEMLIQGMDRVSSTRFAAVRFGNVLGSRGSVIPLFERQIRHGGPVTVTHPDMMRYFMTIPEAVQLVIQAGALTNGGETFILDMGEPVKIANLARDMVRLSGLEPDQDIRIEYTGIRPGEKLFEELLTDEEGLSVTKHDRIFIGQASDFSWNTLQAVVQKLEEIVQDDDQHSQISHLLKTIVPSYEGVEEAVAETDIETEPLTPPMLQAGVHV